MIYESRIYNGKPLKQRPRILDKDILHYVAHRPLGNAVLDLVTMNVGTKTNTVNWKSGSHLDFAGTSNNIEFPLSSSLAYPFVMRCFVKVSGISAEAPVFTLADASASNIVYGILYNNTGDLGIAARNTSFQASYSASPLDDGEWHLVHGVFASATDRRVYQDGIEVASNTTSVSLSSATDVFGLGQFVDFSASGDYNGLIKDAFIINREMSVADIREDVRNPYRWFERVPNRNLFVVSGAGTTINANLESLSVTEYQASILLSKQVDASLEALTTTEYQLSILLSKQVDASLEALTTNEYQSSILLSKQVDANLEALTTTEYSATIQLGSDTNINASLEALTTTEHAASILLSRQVDASLESLTTTEYSATIQLGLDTNINASLEALTTTEYSSSIQFDTIVNSAFENLTTTEYSASVILGVGLVDYESYSCLIKNTAGINSIIKNSLGLNSLII